MWEEIAGSETPFNIEDPANPKGNDLSSMLAEPVWSNLRSVAKTTLDRIDDEGWEAVFGSVSDDSEEDRAARLAQVAAGIGTGTKPWQP